MNEKVYSVQELKPDQKSKYDQEIAELKGPLAHVKDLLESFRTTIRPLLPSYG